MRSIKVQWKESEEKRSKNNSNIVKTNPRNKVEKGYPSAYEVENPIK